MSGGQHEAYVRLLGAPSCGKEPAMHADARGGKDLFEDALVPVGPQSIRPGCWMVGKRNPDSLLQCNTYIRTFEGDGSPAHVCVDPGSHLDFPEIETNINELVGGLGELRGFSINHQDPDVIGNSTHLLEANPDISVMATEEVWRLARQMLYRVVRLPVIQARAAPRIEFASPVHEPFTVLGRKDRWKLVPTPFCHFRGAMAFYDIELRTLFSGDLFGGLNQLGRVHMFAEERDWAGIAQFHQIYMPTRDALRYAVRQIRALDPPVQVIAPQHGHVIAGSLVPEFLERMYELPVGLDLLAVELDETYLDGYRQVSAAIIERAAETLGRDDVFTRLTTVGADGLDRLIAAEGKDLKLVREGYSAVTKIVARLIDHTPAPFANALRQVVLSACADHNLPVPPVGAGLEEGGADGYLLR